MQVLREFPTPEQTVCCTCKKDFKDYVLSTGRYCDRCEKFVPFMKDRSQRNRNLGLEMG